MNINLLKRNCGLLLTAAMMVMFCFTAAAGEYHSRENSMWLTNMEQAKKLSAQKHLPILANFTGSDWCPYCIKLENEVFAKQAFVEFAKKNFILLKIDFPEKTKLPSRQLEQNNMLAKKYKITALPVVMILDKNGNFILKSGYREGGCTAYISFLKVARKLASIYSNSAIDSNKMKNASR